MGSWFFLAAGCDAVFGRILADMEADFGFVRRGSWLEQGSDFAPDRKEGLVMAEELVVDFGEALEDFRLAQKQFTLSPKCSDDIDAHLHGLRATE